MSLHSFNALKNARNKLATSYLPIHNTNLKSFTQLYRIQLINKSTQTLAFTGNLMKLLFFGLIPSTLVPYFQKGTTFSEQLNKIDHLFDENMELMKLQAELGAKASMNSDDLTEEDRIKKEILQERKYYLSNYSILSDIPLAANMIGLIYLGFFHKMVHRRFFRKNKNGLILQVNLSKKYTDPKYNHSINEMMKKGYFVNSENKENVSFTKDLQIIYYKPSYLSFLTSNKVQDFYCNFEDVEVEKVLYSKDGKVRKKSENNGYLINVVNPPKSVTAKDSINFFMPMVDEPYPFLTNLQKDMAHSKSEIFDIDFFKKIFVDGCRRDHFYVEEKGEQRFLVEEPAVEESKGIQYTVKERRKEGKIQRNLD